MIVMLIYNMIFYIWSYRRKEKSDWQLFTAGNMLKGHTVKNIVPYPQAKYNEFLYNNNIALIELREPLVFSRNVSAVCLPKQPIQVYLRLINTLMRLCIANCCLINAFLISNVIFSRDNFA